MLHDLKDKGYTLYILSNWDPTSFALFTKAFPEIFIHHGKQIFDGIMISGHAGIVKPETAIFKKCLQKFNLQAHDTLFIDDEPANIQAADKLGIHTIIADPNNAQALRNNLIELLAR